MGAKRLLDLQVRDLQLTSSRCNVSMVNIKLAENVFSDKWTESRWARRQDGKDTKKKAFDNYFWKRSIELVKIIEPLVKVLRMVDGKNWPWATFMRLWIRQRSRYRQLKRTS